MYIGAHKGAPDDGYVCTSPTFLAVHAVRPQHCKREILGTYETFREAREVEIVLLTEVNAAANTCYLDVSWDYAS